MSEKLNWPLRFTGITEHGYYLFHMHTQTYLCVHVATHPTHTTCSHIHKSITWLASSLMMLLTLMRMGTCSWRQLTMLIMEISHWCPRNKPSCQWMSHRCLWRAFYVYPCGAFPDSTASNSGKKPNKKKLTNTICNMWRIKGLITAWSWC